MANYWHFPVTGLFSDSRGSFSTSFSPAVNIDDAPYISEMRSEVVTPCLRIDKAKEIAYYFLGLCNAHGPSYAASKTRSVYGVSVGFSNSNINNYGCPTNTSRVIAFQRKQTAHLAGNDVPVRRMRMPALFTEFPRSDYIYWVGDSAPNWVLRIQYPGGVDWSALICFDSPTATLIPGDYFPNDLSCVGTLDLAGIFEAEDDPNNDEPQNFITAFLLPDVCSLGADDYVPAPTERYHFDLPYGVKYKVGNQAYTKTPCGWDGGCYCGPGYSEGTMSAKRFPADVNCTQWSALAFASGAITGGPSPCNCDYVNAAFGSISNCDSWTTANPGEVPKPYCVWAGWSGPCICNFVDLSYYKALVKQLFTFRDFMVIGIGAVDVTESILSDFSISNSFGTFSFSGPVDGSGSVVKTVAANVICDAFPVTFDLPAVTKSSGHAVTDGVNDLPMAPNDGTVINVGTLSMGTPLEVIGAPTSMPDGGKVYMAGLMSPPGAAFYSACGMYGSLIPCDTTPVPYYWGWLQCMSGTPYATVSGGTITGSTSVWATNSPSTYWAGRRGMLFPNVVSFNTVYDCPSFCDSGVTSREAVASPPYDWAYMVYAYDPIAPPYFRVNYARLDQLLGKTVYAYRNMAKSVTTTVNSAVMYSNELQSPATPNSAGYGGASGAQYTPGRAGFMKMERDGSNRGTGRAAIGGVLMFCNNDYSFETQIVTAPSVALSVEGDNRLENIESLMRSYATPVSVTYPEFFSYEYWLDSIIPNNETNQSGTASLVRYALLGNKLKLTLTSNCSPTGAKPRFVLQKCWPIKQSPRPYNVSVGPGNVDDGFAFVDSVVDLEFQKSGVYSFLLTEFAPCRYFAKPIYLTIVVCVDIPFVTCPGSWSNSTLYYNDPTAWPMNTALFGTAVTINTNGISEYATGATQVQIYPRYYDGKRIINIQPFSSTAVTDPVVGQVYDDAPLRSLSVTKFDDWLAKNDSDNSPKKYTVIMRTYSVSMERSVLPATSPGMIFTAKDGLVDGDGYSVGTLYQKSGTQWLPLPGSLTFAMTKVGGGDLAYSQRLMDGPQYTNVTLAQTFELTGDGKPSLLSFKFAGVGNTGALSKDWVDIAIYEGELINLGDRLVHVTFSAYQLLQRTIPAGQLTNISLEETTNVTVPLAFTTPGISGSQYQIAIIERPDTGSYGCNMLHHVVSPANGTRPFTNATLVRPTEPITNFVITPPANNNVPVASATIVDNPMGAGYKADFDTDLAGGTTNVITFMLANDPDHLFPSCETTAAGSTAPAECRYPVTATASNPDMFIVSGTVKYPDGTPAPNVFVRSSAVSVEQPIEWMTTTISDEDGHFKLSSAGRYQGYYGWLQVIDRFPFYAAAGKGSSKLYGASYNSSRDVTVDLTVYPILGLYGTGASSNDGIVLPVHTGVDNPRAGVLTSLDACMSDAGPDGQKQLASGLVPFRSVAPNTGSGWSGVGDLPVVGSTYVSVAGISFMSGIRWEKLLAHRAKGWGIYFSTGDSSGGSMQISLGDTEVSFGGRFYVAMGNGGVRAYDTATKMIYTEYYDEQFKDTQVNKVLKIDGRIGALIGPGRVSGVPYIVSWPTINILTSTGFTLPVEEVVTLPLTSIVDAVEDSSGALLVTTGSECIPSLNVFKRTAPTGPYARLPVTFQPDDTVGLSMSVQGDLVFVATAAKTLVVYRYNGTTVTKLSTTSIGSYMYHMETDSTTVYMGGSDKVLAMKISDLQVLFTEASTDFCLGTAGSIYTCSGKNIKKYSRAGDVYTLEFSEDYPDVNPSSVLECSLVRMFKSGDNLILVGLSATKYSFSVLIEQPGPTSEYLVFSDEKVYNLPATGVQRVIVYLLNGVLYYNFYYTLLGTLYKPVLQTLTIWAQNISGGTTVPGTSVSITFPNSAFAPSTMYSPMTKQLGIYTFSTTPAGNLALVIGAQADVSAGGPMKFNTQICEYTPASAQVSVRYAGLGMRSAALAVVGTNWFMGTWPEDGLWVYSDTTLKYGVYSPRGRSVGIGVKITLFGTLAMVQTTKTLDIYESDNYGSYTWRNSISANDNFNPAGGANYWTNYGSYPFGSGTITDKIVMALQIGNSSQLAMIFGYDIENLNAIQQIYKLANLPWTHGYYSDGTIWSQKWFVQSNNTTLWCVSRADYTSALLFYKYTISGKVITLESSKTTPGYSGLGLVFMDNDIFYCGTSSLSIYNYVPNNTSAWEIRGLPVNWTKIIRMPWGRATGDWKLYQNCDATYTFVYDPTIDTGGPVTGFQPVVADFSQRFMALSGGKTIAQMADGTICLGVVPGTVTSVGDTADWGFKRFTIADGQVGNMVLNLYDPGSGAGTQMSYFVQGREQYWDAESIPWADMKPQPYP